MSELREYLVGVWIKFTSGHTVNTRIKIKGISADHARVLAYAKVKNEYSGDTVDDSTVINLGDCEPV